MTDAPFLIHAQDWEITTLGEAARRGGGDIQTGPFGSQLHASDYVATGVPSIMPQNIGDNRIVEDGIARILYRDAVRLSKYRLVPGDIVYSRRGDVERRSLVRPENDGWLCGTGCLRVRFGTGHVVPEYAAYYLGHANVREWIVQHAVGATMPNLNTGILSALPFVLPPIGVQTEIAAALAILDDQIELNRRMNETLEAMAQAIFRDWFVDFGPVRRKLAGATDPVEIMGGLAPDPASAAELAALFPDSLSDGELPDGWSWTTLAAYAELNPESWSARNAPSTVRYVDLSNTKWGVIESCAELDWYAAPSRARRIVRRGDTLVGTVRPGNGSYAFVGEEGLTASTGFAQLRPRASALEDLVYIAATNSENIDRLAHVADGGAYPAVNPFVVLATEVPMVSAELRLAFAGLASPLRGLIEKRKLENRTLAETRDYLLPRLMSGEVRVGAVERAGVA